MKDNFSNFGSNLVKKPVMILIILFLLALYLVINYRNIIIYALILMFSAFLHYKHYKGFPTINFGHIFFFAFIIDWHDGFTGEILFIILAGLLPEILAGYLELKTFLSYPLMIAVISIPLSLIHSNYILMGILSSLAYYSAMFFVSKLTAEPLHERLLEIVAPCILNIFYFTYLAYPFYNLLDYTL